MKKGESKDVFKKKKTVQVITGKKAPDQLIGKSVDFKKK